MIAAIILAAGKGTRIKSRKFNKVTLPFAGRPMIKYGVDLMKGVSNRVVVVTGAFPQSVKEIINGERTVIYAHQHKRLGTAHATRMGLNALKSYSPALVLVGMGDHMMFYKRSTLSKLVKLHEAKKAVVTLVTTKMSDPVGYGRIEKDKTGHVLDIVEEKDASNKQRKIREVNAGLYCFDFNFLKKNLSKIKKSPVSGEYYLTDMVKIANQMDKKVAGLEVPYEEVGIGVNKSEDLSESQTLYKRLYR